jgi:hypothetical protein
MTLYIMVIASAIVVTLLALIPTVLEKGSEY